ncbi:SDR family oxidoreductase [Streptomyces sp. NPDC057445]|uniref:SDR family oxidoreductase n=1 Tax=Streptomyces sp. NPDC057445 TaxID=3346136 RepID=UPI003689B4D4
MNQTILVTGGSGNLGSHVIGQLTGQGRQVRVLSRSVRSRHGAPAVEWCVGDLATGEGLDQALEGVGTVVHCATDGRTQHGDVAATENLLKAGARAGSSHVVYVSIIGVDRHPLPYYQGKYRCEQAIQESGLPWTVLRAAQFHDLVHFALHQAARLPVMPALADTRFQSIDTAEVARRTTELAIGEAQGRVADLPGPQTLAMADMARIYLRGTGRRRPVLPITLPGKVARAYRQGLHLAPAPLPGGRTFEEFLAAGPELKPPAAARRAAR